MFTFYILNLISIIILHPIRLVFLIFRIKYCHMEVLEQPALKVTTIRDQSHANVSKQRKLLADIDMTGKCFSQRNELQQEC